MSDRQLIEKMQHIGALFFRRFHDNLSESDRVALEEWMDQQDPVSREFFEEMTEWDQIQTALQQLYQVDENLAFEDVQKKIHLEAVLAIPTSVKPRSVWRKKYQYAAAAIFLVLTVGLCFVFVLRKKQTDLSSLPVAQRFKNDVPPGGEKAILTLADGSRIVLESASKGELARQGTTKILKLENGKLEYSVYPVGPQSITYNTISTPRGGQYQVQLPDGSKVWLNAASSLRFPTVFQGKERKVELVGEAFFQIAKNPSSPFMVSVTLSPSSSVGGGGKEMMQIEVLGTEFNVMAYPDENDRIATLIDGAVKVNVKKESSVLEPGQQALVRTGMASTSLRIISNINIEEVVAWKNGLFEFQDESIQSIMRKVGRWYDVDIVYSGKVDQQFVGKIPRQVQVSTLLKILESTGWVHFTIDGKKITVAP